ncbi:hypothetical protein BDV29DRAFT_178655 [Aspergillus leporis]|uniref:Uncharacterized protein n=1 Tax=Aspergillus leporis TaxID=41062 RepID=A0A5N5WTV1_9EURO|nr:hypothetical protein BDV29DRAFT_178655 [Aspergillus leporis]
MCREEERAHQVQQQAGRLQPVGATHTVNMKAHPLRSFQERLITATVGGISLIVVHVPSVDVSLCRSFWGTHGNLTQSITTTPCPSFFPPKLPNLPTKTHHRIPRRDDGVQDHDLPVIGLSRVGLSTEPLDDDVLVPFSLEQRVRRQEVRGSRGWRAVYMGRAPRRIGISVVGEVVRVGSWLRAWWRR